MNTADMKRVQRIGQHQCGMLLETNGDMSHVWWGTKPPSLPGQDGIRIIEWIPSENLEPYPEVVVTPDQVIAREKERRQREVRR